MSDPTEVRINLNARVTVRLTPRGREMVAAYYRDLLPDIPHLWPEVPAAGEPYSDQLWSIANILGPGMRPGAHPMIEGLAFTAPVGECVKVVGGEPAPDAPGLDLAPILTRADPADIPALVAEVTRLRTALEQSIARGAVAVEEAPREWEEARAQVKALTGTYTPKAGAEAEDLRRCLERYTDGPLADEMRAILDEVDARDSLRWLEERAADKARIATLESAPTFADGVRAGLEAAKAKAADELGEWPEGSYAHDAVCDCIAGIEEVDPSTVKP